MEEGAYITDVDSISENEDQSQENSFEALVNDFDDTNEKMDQIIEDINESRYHSDEEDLPLDSDDEEIIDDVSDDEEAQPNEGTRRSTRVNAGTGVDRLEPRHDGKTHDDIKKKIQFLMSKEKEKDNKILFSFETGMKMATKAIFTQMQATTGFKIYGERAIAAMFKELKQLEHGPMPGKRVLRALDPDLMSMEDKRKALNAINLIKEKRDGTIKGRTCADGSKQHLYLKEYESVASPTVSLEGLFTTLLIDVYEGRDVATFDIPGAYLHAEMPEDKTVILKLKGKFVSIMCEINPEYKQFVRTEGKTNVLYLSVLRALYGCIESALQWYMLFKSTLENEGFVLNPYDLCVANKIIDGKQCTIAWYVDDNKISHVDTNVVTNILEKMREHFGDIKIYRGNSHIFLGIGIVLRDDRKFEVEMKDQLLEAVEMFGEEITGVVKSPAQHHLFTVDEDAIKLEGKQKEIFHSVTQKLLYITKRARPDLETTVAFLTTRVSKSDVDDWKKLGRLLTWVMNTIEDKRIIGASSLTDLFTWIDAAYAVHTNMRGQTGGAISMGYGILHGKSSKQKINVKSSTESELVGVSEYLPYNIWLMMFMAAQGYGIENNIVYQDNQSTMRMHINGRNSCTGNSRHINVRYFFVKDRIDKGELKVEYCPTLLMIADYFTKPLMGARFRELRDVIMGYKSIYDLNPKWLQPIKERVEKSI